MADHHRNQPASPSTVLKHLPDLTFELSPQGVYIAIHGGPRERLYQGDDTHYIGAHLTEVLPEPAGQQLFETLKLVHDDGEPRGVYLVLPQEGEIHYYDSRITRLESGNCLVVCRRITEAWRARAALERSEEKFRALAQNIPGIVYRCLNDADWTALYISESVQDILGYHVRDFFDGTHSLAACIHPEDRAYVQRTVDDALERRHPYDLSFRMLAKSGEVRQVHERGRHVVDDAGHGAFLDGVIFDITDVHQMRQRVIANHKMAAVGTLAAGVAHEINNPLAIAMANLEYINEELAALAPSIPQEYPLAAALADIGVAVSKAQMSTDRVRAIIDDLRAFSDSAEGRADQIDPYRLVSWAIQRFNAQTYPDNRRLSLDIQPTSPIWASEIALVQIVWNLLQNALDAVDHLHPDEARVELTLQDRGDYVQLKIKDNGLGMSPEVVRRAFEPFFTTKVVGEGIGLGLFVCQGLLEAMDGEISIQSIPGQGTEVQVLFPALP